MIFHRKQKVSKHLSTVNGIFNIQTWRKRYHYLKATLRAEFRVPILLLSSEGDLSAGSVGEEAVCPWDRRVFDEEEEDEEEAVSPTPVAWDFPSETPSWAPELRVLTIFLYTWNGSHAGIQAIKVDYERWKVQLDRTEIKPSRVQASGMLIFALICLMKPQSTYNHKHVPALSILLSKSIQIYVYIIRLARISFAWLFQNPASISVTFETSMFNSSHINIPERDDHNN